MSEKNLLEIFDELVTISEKIQQKIPQRGMLLNNYLSEFSTIKLHLPRQTGKTHNLLHLAKMRFKENCIILVANNRMKKMLINRCKELEYNELSHNIFSNLESIRGTSHKDAVLVDDFSKIPVSMEEIYSKTSCLFEEQPYYYFVIE